MMKKRYRKGTVHPSPPVAENLAFLPAAILTLAAALSAADREVLAYLVSCSAGNFLSKGDNNTQRAPGKGDIYSKGQGHPPAFSCDCFGCYTSYWVRWDTSPNRQLIHEIIDAFEDDVAAASQSNKNRKRKNKGGAELTRTELALSKEDELAESDSVGESGGAGDVEVEEEEKGSVRRLIGFIGERFWGVWAQN